MTQDYKSTLNLPTTSFSMRANLSEREPAVVRQWEEQGVYEAMIAGRKAQGAPAYILHDGPPYANGSIHHGHILNKVLKDFVVKYRNMAGFVCEFVPGWDCHGLPIEIQVDKELGSKKREMTKVEFRQACRDHAETYVKIQCQEFKRMMILADWENPYKTMDYGYEATTVRELGKFFEKKLVYRGFKPVHWDWAAQTALAEAEVEYDVFTTEQVYVKFPFEQLPQELGARVPEGEAVSVVIWTTTPWTLPANLAIALNPEMEYQLVSHEGETYVLAKGRVEAVAKACRWEEDSWRAVATFEGRELVGGLGQGLGLEARHPWIARASVLLPADYVTLEQGTGCVHTAPGHGQEDFMLGQHFGLEPLCPVNQYGKLMEVEGTVKEGLAGLQVHRANPLIAQLLFDAGRLLNRPGDTVTIERYPHGWRSKKPVIFRATTQWFVAMEPEDGLIGATYPLRERALEEITQVTWLPSWGRDRIEGMVEGRPDWCISRQRAWGVPITAMHCNSCGGALATRALADHVAAMVETQGVDVWFSKEVEELLPPGATCPGCGGADFSKEDDILDVWFDSGVSWSAVLKTKLGLGDQADLYLEGSDQHRGWFQSSLLCCLVSRDHSPYKTCLTHGFVMDEKGHKYSKSSKNYEPPEKMLNTLGGEILRLWVSAVDYRGDITLSGEILQRVGDAYRKIRNTFRFLLGALSDFDPEVDAVPLEDLEALDAWALWRTSLALEKMQEGYEHCQFHTIYHTLVGLMNLDLSSAYLDITKDRMYCERATGPLRRSGQTAYWMILDALVRAVAPVLSFTAQEVWELMPKRAGSKAFVFLEDFPAQLPQPQAGGVDEEAWEQLFAVRAEVQRALEAKRGPKRDKRPDQIGSSQEASVRLTASGHVHRVLEQFEAQLATVFIVADVELVEGEVPGEGLVGVEVAPSDQAKCPRCWNFWVPQAMNGQVCRRCASVVGEGT